MTEQATARKPNVAFRWAIFLGGIALLYYLGTSGERERERSETKVSEARPTEVVRVSASELLEEYDANEVATDLRLKGKLVEVTGRIAEINKDAFDNMYVNLETRNRFKSATVRPFPSEESRVASLRKGQSVTFRCEKMKRWVGSPSGSDCAIVKIDN